MECEFLAEEAAAAIVHRLDRREETRVAHQLQEGPGLAPAKGVGLGRRAQREHLATEGLRLAEEGRVRRLEEGPDGLEIGAHSNLGSRRAWNARWASAKLGLCMQIACSSASLSRAVRRSSAASRFRACLVTPRAKEGPRASRSARARASAAACSGSKTLV